jgi:thiamine biosynthesis lipoprotein
LADVVNQAQAASAESDGAFDVTVGPLVQLWGFGPEKSGAQIGKIPSDSAIASVRSHVGYHLLECRLNPPALRKVDPGVYVDLGGIAKGFAAQAVADALESRGVNNCLVAVGGELRAHGVCQTGRPWPVGIETPTPDIRRVFATLELNNASLSTSGDYRNFYELNGSRYCHEIDPRTGRPIPAGLASVSIVDPSGTHADAMATALMVLGPEKGYALARRKKWPVLFIIREADQFRTLTTPEFDRLSR